MMAKKTIFLMIYWPKSVRPKGAVVNVSSGKNRKGVNVRTICTIARFKAALLNNPSINKTPMAVSHMANKMIASSGVRIPKVNSDIVSRAMVSAGLTPGKNLSIPNQRYTIPIHTHGKHFIETQLPNFITISFIVIYLWLLI